MKKNLLITAVCLCFLSTLAYGETVDDALKQLRNHLDAYREVDSLTLTYTQVYEQIPLDEEAADYLAKYRTEKEYRNRFKVDAKEPFVIPKERQVAFDQICMARSKGYQKSEIDTYECKVHIEKKQIGKDTIGTVQESYSDMDGNEFYRRSESSDGVVEISKNINSSESESMPVVKRYVKEDAKENVVVPLPIEWKKFFDHTPKNNLLYDDADADDIVLSYQSRMNGYDDVHISLRIKKIDGQYVPVSYGEEYAHAVKSLNFEDYKRKNGILVPVYIERSYLVSDSHAKTPLWDPYVVRYLLK